MNILFVHQRTNNLLLLMVFFVLFFFCPLLLSMKFAVVRLHTPIKLHFVWLERAVLSKTCNIWSSTIENVRKTTKTLPRSSSPMRNWCCALVDALKLERKWSMMRWSASWWWTPIFCHLQRTSPSLFFLIAHHFYGKALVSLSSRCHVHATLQAFTFTTIMFTWDFRLLLFFFYVFIAIVLSNVLCSSFFLGLFVIVSS